MTIAKVAQAVCEKFFVSWPIQKKTKKSFPNEIVIDDEVIDDPQKICDVFNIHFATIGKKIGKNIKSNYSTTFLFPNSPTSFSFSPAPPKKIHLLIGDIKMKKAVRENGIDYKLLKLSNAVISPILCNIYNCCIQQGEFLDALKIAEVVPVFKKKKF